MRAWAPTVLRSPRKSLWRRSECLEAGRVTGGPAERPTSRALTTETWATNCSDRPRKPEYRQSILDSRWPTVPRYAWALGAACGVLAQACYRV